MDVLLQNAEVVDGTGRPAERADVRVRGDRIVEVGPLVAGPSEEVVDLSGLVLAPGFIDAHTHYDAQILWDPDLTPSSWHGVTTVVMGNCGFGLAPTRPADRDRILTMLENVEGMPLDALRAGVDWSFESFPSYLDVVDRAPKRLNVSSYVGHSVVRTYVLGREAGERPATPDEVARMAEVVGEAMEAGAIGLSTSGSPTHFAGDGAPVPSRLATFEEVLALSEPLGRMGRGLVSSTPGPDLHVPQFREIAAATRRPVSWAGVLADGSRPGLATSQVEAGLGAAAPIWPQITCYPLTVEVSLADPYALNQVDAFREILAVPAGERAAAYADPAWQDRAAEQVDRAWGRRLGMITVQVEAPDGTVTAGPTLAELAAEAGTHPLRAMVDLAIAEDLATRFRVVLVNDGQDELDELLRGSDTVLALSDAGAHTSYLCDADFTTHLLGDYVRRRRVLTLEHAVWRLTGHPAEVFGLAGRGRVAEGFAADLVAFDPATVGTGVRRRVGDLPGGARRMVSRSEGIAHVWVNGEAIFRDGHEVASARPGSLLRGGGS